MNRASFMAQVHELAEQLGAGLFAIVEKQSERARAHALELAKDQLRAQIEGHHAGGEDRPDAVGSQPQASAPDRAALPDDAGRTGQRVRDGRQRAAPGHADRAGDLGGKARGRASKPAARGPQRCRKCVDAGRPGLGHNARTCARESKAAARDDDAEEESQFEATPERGALAPPPTELRVPAVRDATRASTAASVATADSAAELDRGTGPSRRTDCVVRTDPEPQVLTAATIEPRAHRRRRRAGRAELGDRGFTVSTKVSPENLARLDAALAALDLEVGDDQVDGEVARPLTRGDCVDAARPCPFVGCRHHLALDVTEAGSLHVNAQLDLEHAGDTCSLDVADRGEHTLEQVGSLLNITRERVRQIERTGLAKSAASARFYGVRDASPFVPDGDQPEP